MTYLTLAEVADHLKVKPLWLTRWLRAHPRDPQGEPFYHRAGRTKLFTEAGVGRIYAALPVPQASPDQIKVKPCRSSSCRRVKAAAQTTPSGELTFEQKSIKLRELTTRSSPAKNFAGSRKRSNVVAFPRD